MVTRLLTSLLHACFVVGRRMLAHKCGGHLISILTRCYVCACVFVMVQANPDDSTGYIEVGQKYGRLTLYITHIGLVSLLKISSKLIQMYKLLAFI